MKRLPLARGSLESHQHRSGDEDQHEKDDTGARDGREPERRTTHFMSSLGTLGPGAKRVHARCIEVCRVLGAPANNDFGKNRLEMLVDLLRASRRILVFCGAGVSTASGIPGLPRGRDGVWKTRRPVFYDAFMSFQSRRGLNTGTTSSKIVGHLRSRAAETPCIVRSVALERAGRIAAGGRPRMSTACIRRCRHCAGTAG